MAKYAGKYPEIIIDSVTNYQNATGTIFKLTVEQFQDLMHHTHKIGDLIGGDGATISAGEVSKEAFDQLKNSVEQLKNTVQALENSIVDPSHGGGDTPVDLTTIESAVSELSERMTTIENALGIAVGGENSYEDRISALEATVGNTGTTGDNSLIARVTKLENESLNNGLMIDYDIDEPGTQDPNGNTIEP